MFAAASAKKYTNPESLLHAVLILWVLALNRVVASGARAEESA